MTATCDYCGKDLGLIVKAIEILTMSKLSSDFEADIGKKCTIGKVSVYIESVIAEGEYIHPKSAVKVVYCNGVANKSCFSQKLKLVALCPNAIWISKSKWTLGLY